jgi:hypothetical protein
LRTSIGGPGGLLAGLGRSGTDADGSGLSWAGEPEAGNADWAVAEPSELAASAEDGGGGGGPEGSTTMTGGVSRTSTGLSHASTAAPSATIAAV